MNIDKAYVLGLMVGAGTITRHGFEIKLPFRNWGVSPSTSSLIVTDLINKVIKVFKDGFGCDIGFKVDNSSNWILEPKGSFNVDLIKSELTALALPSEGVILNKADISYLRDTLSPLCTEYFLAGLFDAKASLADSHRRFNDGAPVVSIEIPGSTQNFKFVVQLCSWLTDLGSTTDQILYNHPSQHAAMDPTYSNWKKGFKIRFLASSFLAKHSFLLGAKISSLTILAQRQSANQQLPCIARMVSPNPKSIHNDIASSDLPPEVRGKIFLHYLHFCAALGCKHAPTANVESSVKDYGSYVSAFPLLVKGSYVEMLTYVNNIKEKYFPGTPPGSLKQFSVRDIVGLLNENYSKTESAIAYLLSDDLMGNRPRGKAEDAIISNLDVMLDVYCIAANLLAPVFLGWQGNGRGVVLSSLDGKANRIALSNLVELDGININVKKPNERN